MRYMGSKRLLAKHILPIILKDRQEGQWYVEPFCGGCNTLSEVTGNRIGIDNNKPLIDMWLAVIDGWIPPSTISEDLYNKYKKESKTDSTSPMIGYCGFACSYGGKWFGGYPRDKSGKRDLTNEQYRASLVQFPKLKGVEFIYNTYDGVRLPDNSIIYCDPPYQGTTGYKDGAFDHKKFWEWVRKASVSGHRVFVSEYNAPDDFVCIWEKTITSGLSDKKGNEKLFVHWSQHND